MAGDLIAASDQPPKSKPKPKPRPPSRRGRGPTPASWKPGQSGNPHGRPKHQLAFAERVRERVDPDLVIELALRVAHDETMPAAARLAWSIADLILRQALEQLDQECNDGGSSELA